MAYELFHRAVFDYSRQLASTEIAELRLREGQVLAKTRDSEFVFELFPNDERQAPLEALNFGDCEAPADRQGAVGADSDRQPHRHIAPQGRRPRQGPRMRRGRVKIDRAADLQGHRR